MAVDKKLDELKEEIDELQDDIKLLKARSKKLTPPPKPKKKKVILPANASSVQ